MDSVPERARGSVSLRPRGKRVLSGLLGALCEHGVCSLLFSRGSCSDKLRTREGASVHVLSDHWGLSRKEALEEVSLTITRVVSCGTGCKGSSKGKDDSVHKPWVTMQL